MSDKQYVYPIKRALHYRFPSHVGDLIIDRKDAETSEVFMVVIEPSESSPEHIHHDTEQIFFMLEGIGELRIGPEGAGSITRSFTIQPGEVVHIPPHTWHSVRCQGDARVKYLCVDCFIGGRPVAEPTWDAHVAGVCEAQGWDLVIGKPMEDAAGEA